MTIFLLFEDEKYENFIPLTYTRPVYELKTGMFTLRERIENVLFNLGYKIDRRALFMRNYLAPLFRKKLSGYIINEPHKIDEDVLLINGRLLAYGASLRLLEKIPREELILVDGETLLIARLKEASFQLISSNLVEGSTVEAIKRLRKKGIPIIEVKKYLIVDYVWDLIKHNGELLFEDFKRSAKKEEKEIPKGSYLIGSEEYIHISEDVEVEPNVVFNTKYGPIFIDRNVDIEATVRIEGPSYIGAGSRLLKGTSIRGGSNIGPKCKIGGEVRETIIHGFSDVEHYSHIEYSYLGEWIYLEVGTIIFSLKSNYRNVKVLIRGKEVDTRLPRLGCIMGDMVKTSAGVIIYPGKRIGVASQLHGMIIKDVPSFTLWIEKLGIGAIELDLNDILRIHRKFVLRKGRIMSNEERRLIMELFKITMSERKNAGVIRCKVEL